jgi:streptogramin lyase
MAGGSGSSGGPGTGGQEETSATLTLGPATGSSLDFGTVTIPGSATEVYAVTNTGQQASGALDIVLTTLDPFRLDVPTVGNCSNTTALPGGATCTIPVTFMPHDIMALMATLTVSAGIGAPAGLTLVGRGKSPTSGSGAITEFTTPTPKSGPMQIAAAPSGDLYFTESEPNKIARLTITGVITEFPVVAVTSNSGNVSNAYAITVMPDGNVWFTLPPDYIVRMNASGSMMTAFPLPAPNSYPLSITPGPDGNVWFAEADGNNIGRITPTGTITEFPVPTVHARLPAITFVPNGDIWFVEYLANKIGRITTAGAITEYTIPRPNTAPGGIALGPDGNLWFTEEAFGTIGRITQTGVFAEFVLPTGGYSPQSICAGPDGNMWFTESARIGRITTTAPNTIAEWPIPTPSDFANHIVAGADGNLWFTELMGNKIGRILP